MDDPGIHQALRALGPDEIDVVRRFLLAPGQRIPRPRHRNPMDARSRRGLQPLAPPAAAGLNRASRARRPRRWGRQRCARGLGRRRVSAPALSAPAVAASADGAASPWCARRRAPGAARLERGCRGGADKGRARGATPAVAFCASRGVTRSTSRSTRCAGSPSRSVRCSPRPVRGGVSLRGAAPACRMRGCAGSGSAPLRCGAVLGWLRVSRRSEEEVRRGHRPRAARGRGLAVGPGGHATRATCASPRSSSTCSSACAPRRRRPRLP